MITKQSCPMKIHAEVSWQDPLLLCNSHIQHLLIVQSSRRGDVSFKHWLGSERLFTLGQRECVFIAEKKELTESEQRLCERKLMETDCRGGNQSLNL